MIETVFQGDNIESLDRKLAAARAKRNAAQQAENARKQAANQNVEAIAQADQEIRQIELQRAETRFGEIAGQLGEVVERNNHAVTDFLVRMNDIERQSVVLVDLLPEIAQPVDTTFREFMALFRQSKHALNDAIRARLSAVDREDHESLMDIQTRATLDNDSKLRNLPVALHLKATIALWIGQARDDHQRRIREGVGYVMCGEIISTPATLTREDVVTVVHSEVNHGRYQRR